MPSQTLTLNWVRQGESVTQQVTLTADGEHNYDIPIPATNPLTDLQVDITLDVSELKSVYVWSDVAVTLEGNDAAGTQYSIALAANKPLIWYTGCGWANPFTVDVSAMYVSKTGTATGTLKMRFLEDDTP